MLFALVQTKPHVVVLAISPSQDELLKEVTELNASWNHWDLRTERHRYEVQRVPILVRVPPATAAAAGESPPTASSEPLGPAAGSEGETLAALDSHPKTREGTSATSQTVPPP